MPLQFENPANPAVHETTTAQEILKQTHSELDAFIATVGTGGTLTGIAKVLKSKIPHIKIIAVEPISSPVLSGGTPSPHKIQGIGAGFIPKVLDTDLIDYIITVPDEDAYSFVRQLSTKRNIGRYFLRSCRLCFPKVAKDLGPDKLVVTILPDTGERYLSVEGLFSES